MTAPLATPGRRARKKAATRHALNQAAMRLFLARGFDAVTVREIADAADVSTTTLMKHFPTKEALVFDRDDELERELLGAVADRPPGTPLLAALRTYLRKRTARVVSVHLTAFLDLIRATPALAAYWQQMWMRHEHALARALAADLGRPASDPWCAAMAHLVLESAALAERSPHPARMLQVALDILEHGWEHGVKTSAAGRGRAARYTRARGSGSRAR